MNGVSLVDDWGGCIVGPEYKWEFFNSISFCFVELLLQAIQNNFVSCYILVVCLWMLGRCKGLVNFSSAIEVGHHLGDNLDTVIGHYCCRDSELANQLLLVELFDVLDPQSLNHFLEFLHSWSVLWIILVSSCNRKNDRQDIILPIQHCGTVWKNYVFLFWLEDKNAECDREKPKEGMTRNKIADMRKWLQITTITKIGICKG